MLLHLIVGGKYDVVDLFQLNSEEAIEFSHTTDNLTENTLNVIIDNISFEREQLLIAIVNMFVKYCSR
ncbi:MAG: hypothetical protein EBZ36_16325 [Acidobacteria bacterium]|jgi:hypothetical protein|nr:hypothetical protein [Acidobacteriota bacterium]